MNRLINTVCVFLAAAGCTSRSPFTRQPNSDPSIELASKKLNYRIVRECEEAKDTEVFLKTVIPFLAPGSTKKLSVQQRWFVDGDRIFLRGPIEVGDAEYFLRLAASVKNKLTAVNAISVGGDTVAGSRIGAYIFEHGLTAEIEGPCLSSCANYIFGFAKTKIIKSNGFLGFHGNHTAALRISGERTFYDNAKTRIEASFRKANPDLSQNLLDQQVATELEKIGLDASEVMKREDKLFSALEVPQWFFDVVQRDDKGYVNDDSPGFFQFLYPTSAALRKIGFVGIQGNANVCMALAIQKASQSPNKLILTSDTKVPAACGVG